MPRICVFTGSSEGRRPAYRAVAVALGRTLVARGFELVYGGARVGLMGAVADAALAAGGHVIGVIPEALVAHEVAHRGLPDLRVVGSMHQRKALMNDLSDGFIAMPGGWGTLEELFEVLTWGQLGLHRKPCGLLNVAGYFDPLLTFLAGAVEERFVRQEYAHMLQVSDSPDDLLDRFASFEPPAVRKWIDRSST
ncbi:MAG TPA: TIGR00730 family Rossman fold protein [Vicinamibacterales bacterium]|nr:TIGR00730 family Rossman fold protein [Vicinamibacterales bacterium]